MSASVACTARSLLCTSPRTSRAAVTARAVGGPPPDANNALPLLARIQRLDTSSLHKFADLNLAENELNSYCCRLAPDGGMEKCWQAYSFLERKREAAAAGCDVADPTCLELEKLNTMAHDLLATGSMDDLVATFSTLARVEETRAARAAKQSEAASTAAAAPASSPHDDALHVLFRNIDANGDGRLSMAEFRQGMAMLGDELDGATVALIADAMDVHGFITEQQFKDIVEAEALNSKSEVAQLWRHPHLHPHAHLPRLSW